MNTDELMKDIINTVEMSGGATVDSVVGKIGDSKEMGEILPGVKALMDDYKGKADACDQKVKDFQASKKMWKERQEKIAELMLACLRHLGVNEVKNGKLKCAMGSRTVLEVDEGALLMPYMEMAKVWAASVEPYVKVSVSLDKKALNDYVKTNPALLIDRPEVVHSKENFSVTLK